jgi:hypothetical protein
MGNPTPRVACRGHNEATPANRGVVDAVTSRTSLPPYAGRHFPTHRPSTKTEPGQEEDPHARFSGD